MEGGGEGEKGSVELILSLQKKKCLKTRPENLKLMSFDCFYIHFYIHLYKHIHKLLFFTSLCHQN